MSHINGLNRRTFLQSAGMTALLGAIAANQSEAGAAADAMLEPTDGKYDFDTIYSRIGTDCIKWDEQIKTYGKDNIAVGMGIADMDFRTAPSITKALTERMQHENWGYLEMPDSYTQSIVTWNKRRYGIDINPDLMLMSTGVHPALISALRTFSPPGTKVLLQTPTYNGFYPDIAIVGCKPEGSPMKLVNGRYSMDFEDLERRIDHDTNTLILCNPQNPTGNCWSAEDLTRVGEICTRRRVVVLADEIHRDFVMKSNKYTPYSTLPNKEIVKNSISFTSASKSFSLAAMKCAYMFSTNADYIARIKASGHRQELNTLGMVASRAAYDHGEDWLEQCVAYIDGTHDYVESFVRANIPLIRCVKPQGTYLAWLDVSQVVDRIGAKEMAAEATRKQDASKEPVTPEMIVERYLVKHAKIQLNAGSSYGYGGAGHMRMNIATSRKLVELALTNIANALKNPQMSTDVV
jgi:cysteine-S-conjugate beta-lyase